MEACHKFKETKPTDSVPPFQDGDGTIDKVSATNRRMGGLGRPLRRILPSSGSSQIQKVSQSTCPGNNFPVQGDVLRFMHSPSDLHTSHESNCSFPQVKVNSDTHVSRRLADPGIRSGEISFRRSNGLESSLRVRLSDQQEKVRVNANSVVQIPGDVNKPEDRSGSTISGESRESQSLVSLPAAVSQGHSKRLSQFSGNPESHGRLHSMGQTVHKTPTVLSQVFLAKRPGTASCDSTQRLILPPSRMVGKGVKHLSRSASTSQASTGNVTDRCQQVRLGGSFVREQGFRTVDTTGVQDTHKLLRDDGNSSSNSTVQGFAQGQVNTGSFRQYYSSGTHQETRWNTVNVPVCPNYSIIRIVHVPRNSPTSDVHSREKECDGGPIVQDRPGPAGRVVIGAKCIPGNPKSVPGLTSRPICDTVEPTVGSVCVPIPGRGGMGRRRPVNLMGGVGGLRVSTDDSHTPSSKQTRPVERSAVSDSSDVEGSGMVSDTVEPAGGLPEGNPSKPETVKSVRPSGLSLEPGGSKSSRVAFGKRLLLEAGFSEKVASRAVRSHRESSRSLYQSRWHRFECWCHRRKVDPYTASVPVIGDFLIYLFEIAKCQPNTIAGYKSAISATRPPVDGLPVGLHPVLCKLIKNFRLENPKAGIRVPEWDLNEVLKAFMEPPFEPPKWVSLQDKKLTTYKTVFLLLELSF